MDIEFALFIAVVATFLFGVAWPMVSGSPRQALEWRRVAWFPPLLVAVLLVTYVAGEDDYTSDGRSRWEVYEARPTVVAALGLGAAGAGLGLASHSRLAVVPWAALACLAVAVMTMMARLQMTN